VATIPCLLITAERRDGNECFKAMALLPGNSASHTNILVYCHVVVKLCRLLFKECLTSYKRLGYVIRHNKALTCF